MIGTTLYMTGPDASLWKLTTPTVTSTTPAAGATGVAAGYNRHGDLQ